MTGRAGDRVRDASGAATRGRVRLTDAQRIAWLRLIRSERVGPVTFRDLVNRFGGAEAALEALPALSRKGGSARAIEPASRAAAEAELAALQAIGARLVALGEEGYPDALAAIEAPPPLLAIKGRSALAHQTAVAIVGSRDASAAGRRIARTIAAEVCRAGITVASGLARGIDAAAHEAALETGQETGVGGTIAVVAGGIDVVYPPEHQALMSRIGREGLVISELPPGFLPRGQDFPRRNRIISGLSLGVLVVEAARRSGSQITARFALEQGREVMAVPGNPLDPRASGTNQLLKEGATLVTEAEDVLKVLLPMRERPARPARSLAEAGADEDPGLADALVEEPVGSERDRVLGALGAAPIGIDELARETGLQASTVRIVLMELDLAGRIERHQGQRVSLS
ncbi:MAG: DNA-processing protein DprA [Hyphomicrobiaceae bacterium]